MQMVTWGILGMILIGVAGTFAVSLTASRPSNLGVNNGRLAALPPSPNCVATQTEQGEQWMAPLTFDDEESEVMQRLQQIIASMRGATIVNCTDDYLYAEFRSRVFRFVDDVEFFVEADTKRIHFRSASRVGYSDLGVNRERMEEIRRLLETEVTAARPQSQ